MICVKIMTCTGYLSFTEKQYEFLQDLDYKLTKHLRWFSVRKM